MQPEKVTWAKGGGGSQINIDSYESGGRETERERVGERDSPKLCDGTALLS